MSNFHPMDQLDRWYCLTVVAFAIIAFLPWSKNIEVWGMSLFGWLMAALMIFSPIVALAHLLLMRRREERGGSGS